GGIANTFPAMSPGGANQTQTFAPPWNPTVNNTVVIQAPSCGTMGDPCRRRYLVNFLLDGDQNPAMSCVDLTPGNTTWTIEVVASPNILSACVQSIDENQPLHPCIGNLHNVPTTEPVATVDELFAPPQGCLARPGVDVVLVLDVS